jgi:putative ATP-dependent endonuclease of OLD family
MVDPSFASIARSLTVLLSNEALQDFNPARNGLGLNNVLYISIWLEYFQRKVAAGKTTWQLLLLKEPEAYINPQLQRTLLQSLQDRGFHTIVSTHSAHISSKAPVNSYVVLTRTGRPAIKAAHVSAGAGLSDVEARDLDRYLDATRSTLLYARRVILVEGPAELFLIRVLAKSVLGIDLDARGVSVVPIYGVHFEAYAKLFAEGCLAKRCAIVADGYLKPSDSAELADSAAEKGETPNVERLRKLQNEYVKVFLCATTFERAITRAKRVLIYVTDEENYRNRPSPFLLDEGLGVYQQRIVIPK